jgi:hypothetical protein
MPSAVGAAAASVVFRDHTSHQPSIRARPDGLQALRRFSPPKKMAAILPDESFCVVVHYACEDRCAIQVWISQ